MDAASSTAWHTIADSILAGWPRPNPWTGRNEFDPDYDLLGRLLSIAQRQGKKQNSGLFARGADLWIAHELRRAGFGDDEVWPRAVRPRFLPQPLAYLERELADHPNFDAPAWLKNLVKGAQSSRVLGGYYDKEVDVVVADWDRGAELMVSSRSMLSSYKKNLHNRAEDIVGDAENLRTRYRVAAIGLLYVVRKNILSEVGALEFVTDMLLRLRTPTNNRPNPLYDATCLVIAEWSDNDVGAWKGMRLPPARLPDLLAGSEMCAIASIDTPIEVAAGQFFVALIDAVLTRTPVDYHVAVRELRP